MFEYRLQKHIIGAVLILKPLLCQQPGWEEPRNCAQALQQQRRYEEAEGSYRKALELAMSFGERDRRVGISLAELAEIRQIREATAEAESLFIRAASILKSVPAERRNYAACLHNLAGLYHGQAKYRQALGVYLEVLPVSRQLFRPDDPNMAQTLLTVAQLYSITGRYQEAEQSFLEGLRIADRSGSQEHELLAANSRKNL